MPGISRSVDAAPAGGSHKGALNRAIKMDAKLKDAADAVLAKPAGFMLSPHPATTQSGRR